MPRIPRANKRASYREAVDWIALNDNAGNGDGQDDVAGYISTALVADLFGTTTELVAIDIMRVRKREGYPEIEF